MKKEKNLTPELTERLIEKLTVPTEGRDEHFDGKVGGLGLRISHTGRKTWFVLYRHKGELKLHRQSIGTHPEIKLAEARTRAQEIILLAGRGSQQADQLPGTENSPSPTPKAPAPEPSGVTFKEMAAEYLVRHAKANKRSWQKDEWVIEHEFNPIWGERPVASIKRREIIALLDEIRDRGAPIQSNRTLSIIRKIFNWALEREIVETNPCFRVKPVAKENQRDRVLSTDEIKAVWAAFERQDQLIASMLKLRLLTAQRGGEVEKMRWADLDLAGGWWTIPAAVAKNKISHRVPLSAPVLTIIHSLRPRTGHQDWVFPSPSKPGKHIANVQKAAERVRELSGVKDLVLHDLRRTAASLMASMGVQRLVISKILNHAEGGVTRIYDRYSYDQEKRVALEAWAERLGQITGRKQTEKYRQALSDRLRVAREEAGLLQGQAARMLGVPQSILNELEHGQRRLDMAELMAIASIYGKEPSWFLVLPPAPGAEQKSGK